jgi:hypothetical protein
MQADAVRRKQLERNVAHGLNCTKGRTSLFSALDVAERGLPDTMTLAKADQTRIVPLRRLQFRCAVHVPEQGPFAP